MIHSMTAFARGEVRGDWGNLVCEIRSINHRYLDMVFYLPDMLRTLEMSMRESIRKVISRGKIECSIRYQPNAKAAQALFTMNGALVQALCQASEKIASFLGNASASSTDILRFPGVLETKEADLVILQKQVFHLLEKTLHDLAASRKREGDELTQLFFQRLDSIQQELVKIRQRLPLVLKEQKERLVKRFTEAKVELDPARLEQEMVIFAQKIDVAEEVDRTETHITETRRVLNQGGAVGRRLDFLLQELNRESNTLGSKSLDSILMHAAVEMKVLIEQMREQVQNVE
ncbi:MAG: YicC family protein [Gammaproteobacteria bacterium RIFCSPHIGHO2_12_FULL_37_34]|nr:MAG: YicC family protein [Gammaproteobacteria bacterium RIFCSPHIGHO2_12_FULL_37_34]